MCSVSFNVEDLVTSFRRSEVPSVELVNEILNTVEPLLAAESNVVAVPAPPAGADKTNLTVVGDIHGQFDDLVNIFTTCGTPSKGNPYVFLGDYVDRGTSGLEVALTVFAYKIAFPDSVWALRGNHEEEQIAKVYGFTDELNTKFGEAAPAVATAFWRVFNRLPLAAVIGNSIFAVHAALPLEKSDDGSERVLSIAEVNALPRNAPIPVSGPINEMTWGDPVASPAFFSASPRGCGHLFGPGAAKAWLDANNLTTVIRSHQLVMGGFYSSCGGRVVTIFSARNYCNQCANQGGVARIDADLGITPVIFPHVPGTSMRRIGNRRTLPSNSECGLQNRRRRRRLGEVR